MEQMAPATAEIDPRPFEVEVHLTTGQIVRQHVDPREMAPKIAHFRTSPTGRTARPFGPRPTPSSRRQPPTILRAMVYRSTTPRGARGQFRIAASSR